VVAAAGRILRKQRQIGNGGERQNGNQERSPHGLSGFHPIFLRQDNTHEIRVLLPYSVVKG
jgi:hypothetical protein